MPLHDYTDRWQWPDVHLTWIVELKRDVKAKLPPGYRVTVGASPFMRLAELRAKPDVDAWRSAPDSSVGVPDFAAPDAVAEVTTIDLDATLQIDQAGRLVAAIELVSPSNKHGPEDRDSSAARYSSYMRQGVNLLLLDVHRRPLNTGLSRGIAAHLEAELPAGDAPEAVAYRVGDRAPVRGRMVAVWRRPLTIGQPLPEMPLPLSPLRAIMVDLEGTYMKAARDCDVE